MTGRDHTPADIAAAYGMPMRSTAMTAPRHAIGDPQPMDEWTLTDTTGRAILTVIDEKTIAAGDLATELLTTRRAPTRAEIEHVYAALQRLRADRGWMLVRAPEGEA